MILFFHSLSILFLSISIIIAYKLLHKLRKETEHHEIVLRAMLQERTKPLILDGSFRMREWNSQE